MKLILPTLGAISRWLHKALHIKSLSLSLESRLDSPQSKDHGRNGDVPFETLGLQKPCRFVLF